MICLKAFYKSEKKTMEENFCNASLWSNCSHVFYLMFCFSSATSFFFPFLQDNYAIKSFERGISAQNAGVFAWEIVPVCFLIPFQAGESSQSTVSSRYHLIILLCRLKFLGEEGSLPQLLTRMKV